MSAVAKSEQSMDVPAEAFEGPPAPITREMLRSRRKRAVRAHSISVKRMTKRELYLGQALYPADEFEDVARPKTRAECIDGPRPCPFVSCAHHLYLDVSAKTGAIKLNFPDIEPDEMLESCALDVADRGGVTLEQVGEIMNLTRERIRQIEVKGMAEVRALIELGQFRGLLDHVDDRSASKRRLPVLHDEDDEKAGEEARADEDSNGEASFDPIEFASDVLDSE